jgi:hypothetical protein
MALTEEEKLRIREEELIRFQTRHELRSKPTPTTRTELAVAIGVPVVVMLAFLLKAVLALPPVN